MITITLLNTVSGYNMANISSNFETIKTALTTAVTTESGGVNTMNTSIDMNGNQLRNVGGCGSNVPEYTDNASAVTGGRSVGDWYKTATGEVRIVV